MVPYGHDVVTMWDIIALNTATSSSAGFGVIYHIVVFLTHSYIGFKTTY
jgi:hypothetical protein